MLFKPVKHISLLVGLPGKSKVYRRLGLGPIDLSARKARDSGGFNVVQSILGIGAGGTDADGHGLDAS